jgi:hypothetical protein
MAMAKKKVKEKLKIQFSKKVVIYSMTLVPLTIFGNCFLAWWGRETLSEMTIAVITSFSAFITGCYFALSGVRDCSKSKHGIKEL